MISVSGRLMDYEVNNRDECFDVLDHYIAIGWGNVPANEREAIVADLGYLPEQPPVGYAEKAEGYSQTCRESRLRVIQEQKARAIAKERERIKKQTQKRMARRRVAA